MLTVDDLTFSYRPGEPLLNGVTFVCQPGTCTLISGRNGSGKSSLLRLLAGLLVPSSGTVRFDVTPAGGNHGAAWAATVSLVFQFAEDQLCERTVLREASLGPRLLKLSDPEGRGRNALDEAGLNSFADRHPYDLEPAQRKLLMLAGAVASGSPVLLLDEPVAGLGAAEVDIARRIIRRSLDSGVAVVLVSHDHSTVWDLVDRVLVLSEGKFTLDVSRTADLDPAETYRASHQPLPAALLALTRLDSQHPRS